MRANTEQNEVEKRFIVRPLQAKYRILDRLVFAVGKEICNIRSNFIVFAEIYRLNGERCTLPHDT